MVGPIPSEIQYEPLQSQTLRLDIYLTCNDTLNKKLVVDGQIGLNGY